jgi:Ca2+-binding EF-hand superfamily protein
MWGLFSLGKVSTGIWPSISGVFGRPISRMKQTMLSFNRSDLMKRFSFCVAVLAVSMLSAIAMAGEPGGGQGGGQGGRRGGGGGFGGPGGRGPGGSGGPPMSPLMIALDTDEDGELSAKEIANAVAALKKLDKNNDGKLTREEMRPSSEGRGRDGGGRGQDAGGRGQDGGRGRGGSMMERLMGFDKNKDGKVTKDEMPEQMKRMLDRGDANKDGALDRTEIEKMVERFRQGGGREGRGGGQDGGRGGQDSGRPQRPL